MKKTTDKGFVVSVHASVRRTPRLLNECSWSDAYQQTLPMELSAMRDYARKRKWIVAAEVKISNGA